VVGCYECSNGTLGPMFDCRRVCLVLKQYSVNSHHFRSDHMDWIDVSHLIRTSGGRL
jgi:hypothetical protein